MITCTHILGSLFVRQGDIVLRLGESEAIALKRHLRNGFVMTDGDRQIELDEAGVATLTAAISAIQKLKHKRRAKDRRSLWN